MVWHGWLRSGEPVISTWPYTRDSHGAPGVGHGSRSARSGSRLLWRRLRRADCSPFIAAHEEVPTPLAAAAKTPASFSRRAQHAFRPFPSDPADLITALVKPVVQVSAARQRAGASAAVRGERNLTASGIHCASKQAWAMRGLVRASDREQVAPREIHPERRCARHPARWRPRSGHWPARRARIRRQPQAECVERSSTTSRSPLGNVFTGPAGERRHRPLWSRVPAHAALGHAARNAVSLDHCVPAVTAARGL